MSQQELLEHSKEGKEGDNEQKKRAQKAEEDEEAEENTGAAQDDEDAAEEQSSSNRRKGGEEEEEDEEDDGGGAITGNGPFLDKGNGEYLDRRGSVLLGHPASSSKKGDRGDVAPVKIPEGLAGQHPRHGSSFVSSVFRTVGPAVPR